MVVIMLTDEEPYRAGVWQGGQLVPAPSAGETPPHDDRGRDK